MPFHGVGPLAQDILKGECFIMEVVCFYVIHIESATYIVLIGNKKLIIKIETKNI